MTKYEDAQVVAAVGSPLEPTVSRHAAPRVMAYAKTAPDVRASRLERIVGRYNTGD